MRTLRFMALICAGAVAACAGPAFNRDTSVQLNATPETAQCDVEQNGKLVATSLSGSTTVRVQDADAPLAISCSAPGFETLSTEVVAAAFQSAAKGAGDAAQIRLTLKPVDADATTQVDCSIAGLSLKMSARDCQKLAGATVIRYYEVPLVQSASLEWSGVMPPNWRATGKPLSLIEQAQ